MKLFTVIEIPDEDYELSKEWAIDIDGEIIRLSEDGYAWLHYKSPQYDYKLRPLPQKLDAEDPNNPWFTEYRLCDGYNQCIDEIIGEEND